MNVPPAECQVLHYENQDGPVAVVGLKQYSLWRSRGG